MRIRFDDIPPEGLDCEIKEHSWFPEGELERSGPLAAAVRLSRDGERVLLEGSLEVALDLVCDRCLAPWRLPVKADFRLVLELVAAETADQADEHICRSDEMDTVALSEPLVDLDDLLRQQLYLSLPAKSLCREECRGLCPVCGADLNQGACNCRTGGGDSPFAVLGRLKK